MKTIATTFAIAITLATTCLAGPPAATEKALSLKVVGVHDGDTITGVNQANEQVKVRLDAIDAPELKQPFGQAALPITVRESAGCYVPARSASASPRALASPSGTGQLGGTACTSIGPQ